MNVSSKDFQTSNIHFAHLLGGCWCEFIHGCTHALTEIESMKQNVKDGQLSQWVHRYLWTQIGLCS